ncbi:hypothetical protein CK203_016182 [Vitis vinifera]|uniref:Uncharacterized protein n=1 Tax=Vitis vinifera TaxID=29760 RepID=A0A438JMR1_VITVI|nr:hypothetical protein CK203_016182 [Vitis vinifera]
MGHTSNDLLHLEHKASSSSSLESTLLVCKNGSESKLQKPNHPKGKPITTPVPSSQGGASVYVPADDLVISRCSFMVLMFCGIFVFGTSPPSSWLH